MASPYMDSILTSIKKMLGLSAEYEHFDPEIIGHINTYLMTLNQIGVGPAEGFFISGADETWADFIGNRKDLEAIKTYVYLRVKVVFDSSSMGASMIDAMNREADRLEWRLNTQVETTQGG